MIYFTLFMDFLSIFEENYVAYYRICIILCSDYVPNYCSLWNLSQTKLINSLLLYMWYLIKETVHDRWELPLYFVIKRYNSFGKRELFEDTSCPHIFVSWIWRLKDVQFRVYSLFCFVPVENLSHVYASPFTEYTSFTKCY